MAVLGAAGAVLAAASVALSAYAAHAGGEGVRERLYLAAVLAFGHGVALAAMSRDRASKLESAGLAGLLAGTLLFSGSIAAAQLFGTSTRLAPLGGGLLMLSWLVLAIDRLKR